MQVEIRWGLRIRTCSKSLLRDTKRQADQRARMASLAVNTAENALIKVEDDSAILEQPHEAQIADEHERAPVVHLGAQESIMQDDEEGFRNNESCEDHEDSARSRANSTTKNSSPGEGFNALPYSDGDQSTDLTMQGPEDTAAAADFPGPATENFSVPTTLFASFVLREPASLHRTQRCTNWDVQMENLTQRMQWMLPKWNPSWEPNLLAMPAEVTTTVFSFAVAPSQLPDFNPDFDIPNEVYQKVGHFSLHLRTVNKHFDTEVMRTMKNEVPWVKLSIRHPLDVSGHAEAHIKYLEGGQMCIEEDSFGGSMRPS